MAWSKDNGQLAKRNAEYAKEQGEHAKNEASNLSQLKKDVTNAATEAAKQASYAKNQGDYAKTQADQAKGEIDNAKAQAEYAKKQGDYAKAEADKIKDLDDAKFNQRLIDVEDQMKDTERQTQKLQHGLSVINGTVGSPVDIEIHGRTLVNLIHGTSPFVITLDPTKYYLLVTDNNSTVTVDSVSQSMPHKFTNKSTVTLTWATGNPALYEVSQADYSKILVDWDSSNVLNRYPYVKGIQHLQNVAIITEGENLIPPFTEWILNQNAKIISPYELELNGSGSYNISRIDINVMKNQSYTISGDMKNFNIRGGSSTGPVIVNFDGTDFDGMYTFNTGAHGTISIGIFNKGGSIGKFIFKDIMLTIGTINKPFVPRNPSYLFTDVKLGHIGTSKDLLYQQDGQWLVRKAINKDILLYGTLNWRFIANDNLFKKVGIQSFLSENARRLPYIITKYNGFVLGDDYNNGNGAYVGFNDNFLYLSILNEDSGFISTYSPNSNEIKAYFNGWQVKTADTTGKPTAWKSIVDGTDAPTQTLAYVSTNMAKDYTPYKLSYVLATPQIINVTDKVEGDIAINGLTQVEVTSGVIVREKVVPLQGLNANSATYYINTDGSNANHPNSRLRNRADKIVKIYRNGQADGRWLTNTGLAYGNMKAYIPTVDYDPTAEYTVTYLALDRHQMTVNATDVKATYANNIRSALDDVVVKQSDIATTVSVNVSSIAELYKRVRLLEGV